jgi:hypothetical protein
MEILQYAMGIIGIASFCLAVFFAPTIPLSSIAYTLIVFVCIRILEAHNV